MKSNAVAGLYNTFQLTGAVKLPDQRVEDLNAVISVSINKVPILDFQDSTLERNLGIHFKKALLDNLDTIKFSDNRTDAIYIAISARHTEIGFSFRIPKCSIELTYDSSPERPRPPTTIHCALVFAASVEVNTESSNPNLRIEVHDGEVTSVNPENPTLASIMNGAVMPFIIKYMNKKIKPIEIPTLTPVPRLELSPPPCSHGHIGLGTDLWKDVVIQQSHLIACSALGSAIPDTPPAFHGWPAGVFIGADAALLTVVGNAAIAQLPTPRRILEFFIFSGEFYVSYGNLSDVVIREDGSGTVDATISADAEASLTAKIFPLRPRLRATIRARARLTIKTSSNDEQLYIRISEVRLTRLKPEISVQEYKIPIPITDLHIKSLEDTVSDTILGELRDLKKPVLRFPSISVPTANGTGYRMHLKNTKVWQINPAGESLIVTSGIPTIASDTEFH
ncbi:hypothetical protein ASPBRDRAFT_70252 [Aspergillus brasiliensis CBS 101740]|uniref:Uncharacterized protein n=1 Tax=Aspergillus brasiliensis (strain CBS 101740 / IMI 381727 / IBT 21946) TaxID=767769 RepID=A0A1L9U230_ASPBC|nr:hypothetical protein ASPBRDRAFT_70252 [Aspergillus brasiliensis CBS 101740]